MMDQKKKKKLNVDDKVRIAERIYHILRDECAITEKMYQQITGAKSPTMYKWPRGESFPTLENLILIIEFLKNERNIDLSLDYLIFNVNTIDVFDGNEEIKYFFDALKLFKKNNIPKYLDILGEIRKIIEDVIYGNGKVSRKLIKKK